MNEVGRDEFPDLVGEPRSKESERHERYRISMLEGLRRGDEKWIKLAKLMEKERKLVDWLLKK